MEQETVNDILEKLANNELAQYRVTKEDFLSFQQQLIKRSDFKHFRGIAQHKGEVIYEYTSEPRS